MNLLEELLKKKCNLLKLWNQANKSVQDANHYLQTCNMSLKGKASEKYMLAEDKRAQCMTQLRNCIRELAAAKAKDAFRRRANEAHGKKRRRLLKSCKRMNIPLE